MKNLEAVYMVSGSSALRPQVPSSTYRATKIVAFPQPCGTTQDKDVPVRCFERPEGIPFGNITRGQAVVTTAVSVFAAVLCLVI